MSLRATWSCGIQTFPVTYALAVFIVATSTIAFFDNPSMFWRLGVVPSDLSRHFGINLFTCAFVHDHVLHLVGNLFLVVALGRMIENTFSGIVMALVFFTSVVSGSVVFSLSLPESTWPAYGASGGVAGMLVFVFMAMPGGTLFQIGRYKIVVKQLFTILLIFQIFGVWLHLTGFTKLSLMAHLGGATAGVTCYVAMRMAQTFSNKERLWLL